HTDQGVDLLDVVVVEALEVGQYRGILGEILELGDRVEADLATELVVARHATLTVTQNVDGGQVDVADQRHRQVAQEVRVVVQSQRTRVGNTEGVPQALRIFAAEQALGIAVTGILDRHRALDDVGADVIDIDL